MKLRKLQFLSFLLVASQIAFAQQEKLADYKIENIKKVISLFQQRDIDSIGEILSYPLKREYPIANIQNETEFKERFSDVFDENIIDKIASSQLSQWSEVGWRGIMLDNGLLWIDDDGKIIALNYQSDFEKGQKDKLLISDKESLDKSLRNFESAIYKVRTKNYLIRIDELKQNKYRYEAWKIDADEFTIPDLVLKNGIFEFQGSGGNHIITFKNGKYSYVLQRNILGTDESAEVQLIIEKSGKVIAVEDGSIIN